MTIHYFYIIYSAQINKYYLGETSDLGEEFVVFTLLVLNFL